jgi:hypothetical protein
MTSFTKIILSIFIISKNYLNAFSQKTFFSQKSPYFFWLFIPITVSCRFKLSWGIFDSHLTLFDIFLPFFILSVMLHNINLIYQKIYFVFFGLIALTILHFFIVLIFYFDINQYDLIRDTLKYSYFLLLIAYFYTLCTSLQDYKTLSDYYYCGYFSIVVLIAVSYIEWDIFNYEVTIRTFISGLICSLLTLIFYFIQNKQSSKMEHGVFLIFCFIAFCCFKQWTLESCVITACFIGVIALFTMLRSSFSKTSLYSLLCIIFALIFSFYIKMPFDFNKSRNKINIEKIFTENEYLARILNDRGLRERLISWRTATYYLFSHGAILGTGAGQFPQKFIEERQQELMEDGLKINHMAAQLHNSFVILLFNFGIFSIVWFYFLTTLFLRVLMYEKFQIFLVFSASLFGVATFHDVFFIHLIALMLAFFIPRHLLLSDKE